MVGTMHKVKIEELRIIRHRLVLPHPSNLKDFGVKARNRMAMGITGVRCVGVVNNNNSNNVGNSIPQQVAKTEVRLAVDGNELLPPAIFGVHGLLPPRVALLRLFLKDIRGSSGLYVLFRLEWLRRRIRLPRVLLRGAGRDLLS